MYKKTTMIFAAAMLCSATMTAQRTPSHHFDFETIATDSTPTSLKWDNFYEFFDSWQPGTPPNGLSRMDDEFFISRQRPLQRITDGDYQVRSDVPSDRKMLLWVPLDDPTSTWKALPRYCFEGDNFSMWQYINCHGNWTAPWLRVSAGISDAAAKNGVTVGCVMSVPWNEKVNLNATNTYSKVFQKLMEKNDDGTFKNTMKLAKLMKYYGINGLGVNSEFTSNSKFMTTMQDFFIELHKKAEEIGWKFELQWYDLTKDDGSIIADTGLGRYNKKTFGSGDKIVTDQMFANYNWDKYLLQASVKYAESLNRSPYDYYAGFDIQGRGLKNENWQDLINSKISIGFWGAHSQSLLHQSATDDGTSDIAIQKAYLQKQELTFSGGNRNPALLPYVRTDCSLSNADLKTFHGLASLLTAKSTIQSVPFVTRFNLGNGLKYYKDGNIAFDSKWYNLSTQDYLPTWRFWITDRNDEVTDENISTLAHAELSWDDVYTGGSSLKLYGKTDFSRIKLFKTMLATQPSYELSATYKLKTGTDTHARLFVALKNDIANYKEIALPTTRQGEWTTFYTTLDKLGLQANDTVAMIGITLENTADNYQMNIGELAMRNPAQQFATIQPKVKEVEVVRGWHNSVDFKMRYASKEETGEEKTYNDEVGTWYYEIYFQQKGKEPQLLTATTSWAAYVVGAPLDTDGDRICRFGVRAVSPDGVQGSDISWSDYQEVAYTSHDNTLRTDHSIIKPDELFTISYEDRLMPKAQKWQIANSATGEIVATAENASSISTAIHEVGNYDLMVTDSEGGTAITRGYISITPEETGAMPKIYDITASKPNITKGEFVDYTFTSRKADGKVSRGAVITDPDMLSIPAATLEGMDFSIGLWFKADYWAHDKEGTNLISKNTIADSWPYNNWGDIWVQVRPEMTDSKQNTHHANEISFNTLGHTDMDDPNIDMLTTGYSITPGVWNHIFVTQDANKVQKIYLNGKCVAGPAAITNSTRREQLGLTDSRIDINVPANIYIGGGGVYKAGFNGTIDEVQIWDKALTDEEVVRAMKGYADSEVPDHLLAYYTFEDTDDNGMFANHGKLAGNKAYMVRTSDAGGENTSTAQYIKQPANNSQPGYPGITGSLDVATTASWQIGDEDGMRIALQDNKATVSYPSGGKKDVALTIANIWGTDSIRKADIVDVDGSVDAISNVDGDNSFSVFPNPFVESVNFRFGHSGTYTIDIVTPSGVLLQSSDINAVSGQTVNVRINGLSGLYIVKVMKDGKLYKTVKIVKE